MFGRENYKDDYFKNLSFIKKISNEQGKISIMEENIPNKELLKLTMKDGSYPAFNANKSMEEITGILSSMLLFLNEIKPVEGINEEEDKTYLLNSFLRQNKVDFRPISMKQIDAGQKMQRHLLNREYNKALHELANCIEDNGKGLERTKYISVNEYALYTSLVTAFYNQITVSV